MSFCYIQNTPQWVQANPLCTLTSVFVGSFPAVSSVGATAGGFLQKNNHESRMARMTRMIEPKMTTYKYQSSGPPVPTPLWLLPLPWRHATSRAATHARLNFQGTPLGSGRITHLKRNFFRKPVIFVDVCRA